MNKVETAVEALWHVEGSRFFTEEERARIAEKLMARMNADGYISVRSTEARSQLENKEIAVKKLHALVARSLVVPRKRIATKPSKASKETRLESKKRDGEKKAMRRQPKGE